MQSLRDRPPHKLGGYTITKMVDYWDEDNFGPFVSETDKLPRNVLQVFTEACVVIIRPSGTEPKLKFYCQLLPQEGDAPLRGRALLDEVRTKAETVARQVYNDLLAYLDYHLSEASLLLPDIIDLERKQYFDQHMAPQFRQALFSGNFINLNQALSWLREEGAAMVPGADPLPALKVPFTALCKQWSPEGAMSPVLTELTQWAQE
jgi:hypothetical protein